MAIENIFPGLTWVKTHKLILSKISLADSESTALCNPVLWESTESPDSVHDNLHTCAMISIRWGPATYIHQRGLKKNHLKYIAPPPTPPPTHPHTHTHDEAYTLTLYIYLLRGVAYITAVTDAEYKSEFEPTKTIHTSPWRASYGVPFVRNLEKIDCVIPELNPQSTY